MTYPRSYSSHIKSFHVLMGHHCSNMTELLDFTPLSLPGITCFPHLSAKPRLITVSPQEKEKGEDVKLYNQYDPHYETLWAYLAHVHVEKKLEGNTQNANWDRWRNANDLGFCLFRCSAFFRTEYAPFSQHLLSTYQVLDWGER